MLGLLLDCGSFIVELFNKKRIKAKEQKEAVSKTLEDISILLANVAISLDKSEYPTEACYAMHTLSTQLLDRLIDVLDVKTAEELCKLLQDISQIERMYQFKDLGVTQEIRAASGKFYAASILART